jgi:hypothetical protein
MHPRERVLGLAALLDKKGKAYPKRLIIEANRLGVHLPKLNPPNVNKTKESNNGSEQQS